MDADQGIWSDRGRDGTVERVNEQLASSINRATLLAKAFIAWNLVFFAVSIAAEGSIADDAVGPVLIRQGFFAVAGLLLVYLLAGMRRGRRGSWLRLGFVSTIAPLGVIAFLVLTPDLPLWFDLAQIGSGLMLVGIAVMILRSDVRQEFAKVPKKSAAQDSPA